MKKFSTATLVFLMFFLMTSLVFGQQIDYLSPEPLSSVVRGSAQSVSSSDNIPLITWGGDVATIYTAESGIFKNEGINANLFAENDFKKQVEGVLAGKTPYLRGTIGMINAASEVFKQRGIDLTVVYQLTWSTGGDAMVVRGNIKTPADLKGKTIALQLYGPHMDYVLNVLTNAGVSPKSVTFKWLRELTLPTYDTKRIVDPVSAFEADNSVDAVMCIIPDALRLTSGGTVGSGAEGSVKGAKIMLSTKTASRVIADVYAVRSDYFKSNKSDVQKFVHALMKGQEAFEALMKNRKNDQAKFQGLMSKSASLLMGSSTATADVEGMLGDCEFVGFNGNVAFFTGKGTGRTLPALTGEIQPVFQSIGLMSGLVGIPSAEWDYSALAVGIASATSVPVSKPAFEKSKVSSYVEKKIAAEPQTWESEGTLFLLEINFGPNQSDFSEAEYANDFSKALKLVETNAGALVTIEGHSDPLGVLKAREKKENPQVISQMEQATKNLSYERAREVLKTFTAYAKKTKGVKLDESMFVPVGMGITSPKYSPPKTKEEWTANRRVVFRVKNIEAEASEFTPITSK